MKVFVAVAVLAFVASTISHPVLTEEQKEQYKKAKKECIAESGVDEAVVKKAKCDGVFADDPKLTDFFVCFFKKPGFLNDAGEYQVETMQKKMTEKWGEETAKKLVAECTKEKYGSIKDAALNLAKCYHEHKPKHDKHDEHKDEHEKH